MWVGRELKQNGVQQSINLIGSEVNSRKLFLFIEEQLSVVGA